MEDKSKHEHFCFAGQPASCQGYFHNDVLPCVCGAEGNAVTALSQVAIPASPGGRPAPADLAPATPQSVQNGKAGGSLSRRRFIGALGAAAVAGAFLNHTGGDARAQNPQVYYYQDSYGNIVPAGSDAIALGIYPPPNPHESVHGDGGMYPGAPPSCSSGSTYYAPGYPIYNILLIMVDQMRNPNFWPPPSGSIIGASGPIPNLSNLMGTSFTFPNFFVNATVCGPSRACFQTGLYTQQTCIFRSRRIGSSNANLSDRDFRLDDSQTVTAPPLLPWSNPGPGFPTIGNVLSQALPVGSSSGTTCASYDCTWIGKWHLSCSTATGSATDGPGANGPSDYGYTGIGGYNIPTTLTTNPYPAGQRLQTGYPSPDGMCCEGNGGDFLDSFTQATGTPPQTSAHNVPSFGMTTGLTPQTSLVEVNDAAIASAFTQWLTNMNSQTTPPKWFCAVSFINPHDMSDFPYAFGLTSGPSYTGCPIPGSPTTGWHEPFCVPSKPCTQGYQPPPSPTHTTAPTVGTVNPHAPRTAT